MPSRTMSPSSSGRRDRYRAPRGAMLHGGGVGRARVRAPRARAPSRTLAALSPSPRRRRAPARAGRGCAGAHVRRAQRGRARRRAVQARARARRDARREPRVPCCAPFLHRPARARSPLLPPAAAARRFVNGAVEQSRPLVLLFSSGARRGAGAPARHRRRRGATRADRPSVGPVAPPSRHSAPRPPAPCPLPTPRPSGPIRPLPHPSAFSTTYALPPLSAPSPWPTTARPATCGTMWGRYARRANTRSASRVPLHPPPPPDRERVGRASLAGAAPAEASGQRQTRPRTPAPLALPATLRPSLTQVAIGIGDLGLAYQAFKVAISVDTNHVESYANLVRRRVVGDTPGAASARGRCISGGLSRTHRGGRGRPALKFACAR